MPKFKIIEPTIEKLEDLSVIIINLRDNEKHFQENGGYRNREKMNYWQKIADKWIEDNIEKLNDEV